MPWLTICRMPPATPPSVMLKMPSMTKPRWLTDEYATSFFTSRCTHAQYAP